MRAFAVSTSLSRPSASFCTIAYIATSCAIAVRMLRFGRNPFWMSSARGSGVRVRPRQSDSSVEEAKRTAEVIVIAREVGVEHVEVAGLRTEERA